MSLWCHSIVMKSSWHHICNCAKWRNSHLETIKSISDDRNKQICFKTFLVCFSKNAIWDLHAQSPPNLAKTYSIDKNQKSNLIWASLIVINIFEKLKEYKKRVIFSTPIHIVSLLPSLGRNEVNGKAYDNNENSAIVILTTFNLRQFYHVFMGITINKRG